MLSPLTEHIKGSPHRTNKFLKKMKNRLRIFISAKICKSSKSLRGDWTLARAGLQKATDKVFLKGPHKNFEAAAEAFARAGQEEEGWIAGTVRRPNNNFGDLFVCLSYLPCLCRGNYGD